MSDRTYQLSTHFLPSSAVSAIFDESEQIAIILNEHRGRYVKLSDCTYAVFREIFLAANGKSVQNLIDINLCDENELMDILQGLVSSEIIEIPEIESANQPKIMQVIMFALLFLWYRVVLRMFGWRVVKKVRSKRVFEETRISRNHPLFREIMGIMRRSYIFPWVTNNCVPSSLTVYSFIRLLGYQPKLIIGADTNPFEPHMWVALGGIRIDSAPEEQSLKIFQFSNHFEGLLTRSIPDS